MTIRRLGYLARFSARLAGTVVRRRERSELLGPRSWRIACVRTMVPWHATCTDPATIETSTSFPRQGRPTRSWSRRTTHVRCCRPCGSPRSRWSPAEPSAGLGEAPRVWCPIYAVAHARRPARRGGRSTPSCPPRPPGSPRRPARSAPITESRQSDRPALIHPPLYAGMPDTRCSWLSPSTTPWLPSDRRWPWPRSHPRRAIPQPRRTLRRLRRRA